MLIRRFLEWFLTAPAEERVEATQSFCEAYLSGLFRAEPAAELNAALTLLIDDPDPAVRHCLGKAFAAEPSAPRHVVLALMHDLPEVGVPVLRHSPVLSDADLIDGLDLCEAEAQTAIAERCELSPALTREICARCEAAAVIRLLGREDSVVEAASYQLLVGRFADHEDVRRLLLERHDLPLVLRLRLVTTVAASFTEAVMSAEGLSRPKAERLIADAQQSATLLLAGMAAPDELAELVHSLRDEGSLTPALLLRAVLTRQLALFETALSLLSGVSQRRVASLIRAPGGAGFMALYRRSGMPDSLAPVFRAALFPVLDELRRGLDLDQPQLSRAAIGAALLACSRDETGSGSAPAMALLRRLEMEAIREESRRLSEGLLADMAPIIEIGSEEQDDLLALRRPENDDLALAIDFAAIEAEVLGFIGEASLDHTSVETADTSAEEEPLELSLPVASTHADMPPASLPVIGESAERAAVMAADTEERAQVPADMEASYASVANLGSDSPIDELRMIVADQGQDDQSDAIRIAA